MQLGLQMPSYMLYVQSTYLFTYLFLRIMSYIRVDIQARSQITPIGGEQNFRGNSYW